WPDAFVPRAGRATGRALPSRTLPGYINQDERDRAEDGPAVQAGTPMTAQGESALPPAGAAGRRPSTWRNIRGGELPGTGKRGQTAPFRPLAFAADFLYCAAKPQTGGPE